jgi:hypothetical protein
MTTKVSPILTSKETSLTPTVQPVELRISPRLAPVSAIASARSGRFPKTFQTPSTSRQTGSIEPSADISVMYQPDRSQGRGGDSEEYE